MNELVVYLQQNMPDLSSEALTVVEQAFDQRPVRKAEMLLRQGDICKKLYFLTEGMCRSFSLKDSNDITTWFCFKYDFITSGLS